MSNLDKRWHGNDLSFVQCTNHHWRDLMPLSALSRIKYDYNITSLHGELNIIKTHGSESRGQEEAACMHVFWPTRPLQ